MASNSEKTRAVVLLSGGMDSTVCAALAARDHQTSALHVSYGQRTEERERRAFVSICDTLGIESRLMVKNDALRVIGGSALTDHKITVPEGHAIGEDIGEVASAVQHFQEIIQQIEVIQNQLTSTIESQTTDLRGGGVLLDL